jgi:hypothetical protein
MTLIGHLMAVARIYRNHQARLVNGRFVEESSLGKGQRPYTADRTVAGGTRRW